ncbi:amidohydrolase family protein [Desulfosoma caldarium]|uniref:Cytosine/adenosine deaminase-related metal-dependent hydrolase n=1 Tax=Desulfosoma caldarium TaxID=610254 RepID=A0A3N1UMT1_9BACT|nr:amidohydrolase family protein [Desulfosoma caldarium]ROQ91058.1 cytosine/adenosine deaminase-related metal-dependent hydrolase [Desulfosoma caldarium]
MSGLKGPKDGGLRAVAIHRAPWVFSGIGPTVFDGAVVVLNGRILECGPYRAMRSRYGGTAVRVWDHESAALVPGAVNAHTHLDFSLLDFPKPLRPLGFPGWVRGVFKAAAQLTPSARREARDAGRAQASQTGTRCLANVINPPLEGSSSPCAPSREYRFVELLGFHYRSLQEALSMEDVAEGDWVSLAAHSLYATSWNVVVQAKAWCRSRGLPFSIHVAEHSEELSFVQDGTGFCRDLLESLGRWDASWRPLGLSPVKTLQALGILDPRTLLVHMVHVNEEDWNLVAQSGAAVCFCPRSNLWIEGKMPNMQAAFDRSISCALGTDSRASNEDLNLFREAAAVLDAVPGLHPSHVLRMATFGGARALGLESSFGHLGPGASAPFLAVFLSGSCSTENDVAEAIIHQAAREQMAWIGTGMVG